MLLAAILLFAIGKRRQAGLLTEQFAEVRRRLETNLLTDLVYGKRTVPQEGFSLLDSLIHDVLIHRAAKMTVKTVVQHVFADVQFGT